MEFGASGEERGGAAARTVGAQAVLLGPDQLDGNARGAEALREGGDLVAQRRAGGRDDDGGRNAREAAGRSRCGVRVVAVLRRAQVVVPAVGELALAGG